MGRFDDHTDALKQYGAHRPMQHVQGYTGTWLKAVIKAGNYIG
jgi:hypothetical protein